MPVNNCGSVLHYSQKIHFYLPNDLKGIVFPYLYTSAENKLGQPPISLIHLFFLGRPGLALPASPAVQGLFDPPLAPEWRPREMGGCPCLFAPDAWQRKAAATLGLESTFRERGRPKKQAKP